MSYVVNGAKRMQDLVRAILYYSAVGHNGVRTSIIDLGIIAHTAVASLEDKITTSLTTVRVEALPKVMGDGQLLTQLLQNLISNGIKFRSHLRPAVITIDVQDQADAWQIRVRDNGIGIRKEDSLRIYTLFQRVSSSNQYPGFGIGLATCKKIVERHGGRLWMESTVDVGTEFFFTLPKGDPLAGDGANSV
jgi:light-regulated signal transduction histidine kinase (bacteriophytochrome)